MKPNIGTLDRSIRAIVALVVGIVMLVTALLRWCPPYGLLGINTGARND
jgi:hypothetical protein